MSGRTPDGDDLVAQEIARLSPAQLAELSRSAEQNGEVVVAAYDVPDHLTKASYRPYNGTALLNRLGLAVRARLRDAAARA